MLGQQGAGVERLTVTGAGEAQVALVGLSPVYRYGLVAGLQAAGLTCSVVPDLPALLGLLAGNGPDGGAAAPAVVSVVPADQAAAALPLLHRPAPRPVVLVVDEPDVHAYADALRGGATGVVSTAMELEEAVAVIRSASTGHTLLPCAMARALCRPLSGPAPALAPREREWLRGLADGGTVAGLARRVGYSEREMYRLLSAVYSRLGATSRTEALLLAERWGLLHEEAE